MSLSKKNINTLHDFHTLCYSLTCMFQSVRVRIAQLRPMCQKFSVRRLFQMMMVFVTGVPPLKCCVLSFNITRLPHWGANWASALLLLSFAVHLHINTLNSQSAQIFPVMLNSVMYFTTVLFTVTICPLSVKEKNCWLFPTLRNLSADIIVIELF